MILDNEGQRIIIMQALTNVPIQGDYQGLCEMFPKFKAVVEAVETATIAEQNSK